MLDDYAYIADIRANLSIRYKCLYEKRVLLCGIVV